ncbi:23S rRNA (uracil(1939)-C(5))-methyltransferase RlmD [Aequorivita vladivostokensis]|uniref:RNA methyltransferase n=1 Tax=Aequorivita vladivostokensis TaxID=171194 RepID=A0ABR5DF43_9FLAO|nr:23S rRNA (uracil(1939)-C(5))-methyltransferase RlmD [Aequorivita vladivostokensis]KJJ37405.1 RNA methyltransferase [Aequorivita vladivostokensis]MAB56206.1 23S rRNA (uracil(1939)-C(5))-methyltransferase RlmD [Aequorivita sp.]MBF31989.1 23S rRNA (uracil(1939)-C(5))-methyltransferase RlmD [Aequorivita sp.]HBL80598.1 23S rRNA (uracil(1939)-C(5))-methyltransferase RlmD [Aequorivita sp.]|tara:strand:+ start:343835 stop:345244 length:1410 start_codon:yes stop_codon:yes gene_type:complete
MARKNKRIILEDLEVIDAGAKGKAVAKAPDGRVVFIDNAVPGDVVTVQTFKKKKAFYEGSAISFSKYSEKRVEPVCPHFGTCGGCKWQDMGYEHQLFFKQKEIEQNLKRIGKVELPDIQPILGSEKQYFYRNKMEFSFSDNKWLTLEQIKSDKIIENRNALGFHIPGMWDKILDLEICYLQADPSNAIRDFVKAKAEELNLTFFNTRKQEGFLRTLMIRTSSTGEIMVLLQFFHEDEENRNMLLNAIVEAFPQITSLLYVINSKGNDTLYDQEIELFHGRDHIFEEMEGLKFKINAKSFYQTNSEQAYELYKITRDFAGLTGNELIYDLYTGTGTIAQFVAKKAKKVIGVEAVPDAISAAKENAKLNNIENVEFYVGDMKKVFNQEFISAHGRPDVVITDPPRDGMHGDVVAQLLNLGADKIVYVSCNSATQARDLALLDAKYKVTKVQPVDMFPQTHHVENVVLLEKR